MASIDFRTSLLISWRACFSRRVTSAPRYGRRRVEPRLEQVQVPRTVACANGAAEGIPSNRLHGRVGPELTHLSTRRNVPELEEVVIPARKQQAPVG